MSARSPSLPLDRICSLLSQFYKFGTIDQSSIKEFDSWEDRNYYFEDKTGDKFVLKIMREMPSTSVDLVRGLAEVMLYLHEKRIPCSWPIKALDGKPVVVLKENELIPTMRCEANDYLLPSHECVTKEQQYCVMALTFVEGNLADECPMTSELLHNIGHCFASMDKELQVCHVVDTTAACNYHTRCNYL